MELHPTLLDATQGPPRPLPPSVPGVGPPGPTSSRAPSATLGQQP